jgi:hypothetical protein
MSPKAENLREFQVKKELSPLSVAFFRTILNLKLNYSKLDVFAY